LQSVSKIGSHFSSWQRHDGQVFAVLGERKNGAREGVRRERRTKKRELFALRPTSRDPEQANLECQTNKMDKVLASLSNTREDSVSVKLAMVSLDRATSRLRLVKLG
jgi:hypothetical protein